MTRNRKILLGTFLVGGVALAALGAWALFIYLSRTADTRAFLSITATAESAQLTLTAQSGTPVLGATLPPTTTSAATTAAGATIAPADVTAAAAATATALAQSGTTAATPAASTAPSATATNTTEATATSTPTATATSTPTSTSTATLTPVAVPTNTPSATPTNTPTSTPTNTPTNTPVPFAVTNVTASVNPTTGNSCPTTFNFTGQITANGAGTVTYYWERSSGAQGQKTLVFNNAGTQAVNDSWSNGTAGQHFARVQIVAPNGLTSNDATFTVICPSNFAGFWYTNFGKMTLSQNGNSVSGTYDNSFENKSGTIAGTVTGNSFSGNYLIGGSSGSIQWTLGNSGQTLDGSWSKFPAGGKWCGAHSGTNFPADCAFAGTWNAFVDGTSNASLNLKQSGISVSGTFFNGTSSGTIDGSISYSNQQAVLSGTWFLSSSNHGLIHFYLIGYDDNQFNGNWDTSNPWCGWRNGASKPSPCQK